MNFMKDGQGYETAWEDMERSMTSYRSKDEAGRVSQREDMFEGQKSAEWDWESRK